MAASTVLLILFCLYNAVWNLPVIDFRPFKVGTDLYQKKTAEQEALASVPVTLRLQKKSTGELLEISQADYLKEWQKYPKEEWSTIDQLRGKPSIPITKVSDFSVVSLDGYDVSEEILTDSGDVFLIVAYKLKGEGRSEDVMVPDTIWQTDTVQIGADSVYVVRSIDTIQMQPGTQEVFDWDEAYVKKYTEKVNPFMENVMQQGARVYALAGGAGTEKLEAFDAVIGSKYDWYEADDILLKTMIRSNPGVMHLRAGKVLNMWHIRHLPKTLELQANTAK